MIIAERSLDITNDVNDSAVLFNEGDNLISKQESQPLKSAHETAKFVILHADRDHRLVTAKGVGARKNSSIAVTEAGGVQDSIMRPGSSIMESIGAETAQSKDGTKLMPSSNSVRNRARTPREDV